MKEISIDEESSFFHLIVSKLLIQISFLLPFQNILKFNHWRFDWFYSKYFFHGTLDLDRLNLAYISLTPKKQGTLIAWELRPINLLNSAYKIIM